MLNARCHVVLASASPRRKDLLQLLFREFEAVESGFDEDLEKRRFSKASQYAQANAALKAIAVSQRIDRPCLIVAADTIVVVEDRIFEKPADEREARDMMRLLNGKVHQVVTGVSVLDVCDGDGVDRIEPFEWDVDGYVSGFCDGMYRKRNVFRMHHFCETTNVEFALLSEKCIERYVSTREFRYGCISMLIG